MNLLDLVGLQRKQEFTLENSTLEIAAVAILVISVSRLLDVVGKVGTKVLGIAVCLVLAYCSLKYEIEIKISYIERR